MGGENREDDEFNRLTNEYME
jgi:predicted component of type VI protein secretion system